MMKTDWNESKKSPKEAEEADLTRLGSERDFWTNVETEIPPHI